MKRAPIFLALISALAVSSALLAQQTPAPAPPAQETTPMPAPPTRTVESGFTSLFNGKDLTGWKIGGPAESFSVDQGAIVAHGAASHLFYDGPLNNHMFRNFELRARRHGAQPLERRRLRYDQYQEKGFPGKGFEIQVNISHTDRIRSGSIYHVMDLSYIPAKDDEWYPMIVAVEGDTITVTLKGNQVARWTQPPDWNGAYDTPGRKIAPGTIAFQAHDPGSTTAYANIRVRVKD